MLVKKKKNFLKLLGGGVLTLGILFGFVLCGLIVWGDLEASIFTNGVNGDASVKNLKCPVIITSNEIGTVSVLLKNPADKDSDRFLRASVTEGHATLIRETKTKIPLPANGKQKVEWKIYPEDAAFKRVVLFQVFVNAKYPYPSMSGNCGIIKVDIPWLSGNQILALLSAISVMSLGVGALMWETGIRPANNKVRTSSNGIYFLVGILVATAVFSYLGLWLLGVLGLSIAIIMTGVIIFRC
jgi:hypothetical protein